MSQYPDLGEISGWLDRHDGINRRSLWGVAGPVIGECLDLKMSLLSTKMGHDEWATGPEGTAVCST